MITNMPSNSNHSFVNVNINIQSNDSSFRTSYTYGGPVTNTEDDLARTDITQAVKETVLQHLIDGSIKDDEAQSIVTGVQIMDMQDGHLITDHNSSTEQFAASINKLPVALLVLQDLRSHKLRLSQTMTWQPSDVRGGFGVYDQPGAPTSASLQDVLEDMLNHSGNTAVRVLVNYGLGGAAAVNDRWATMPELNHTRLQPLDASRFYLGNSTPHDSLWALTQILNRNDHYSRVMKNAMATNIFTDYGVRSQLSGNTWITLVNKVGILDDVDGNNRHDTGVIYNTHTHKSYAYSFMTTSPNASTTATPQAEQSLKDMGRYLLRYAGDTPSGAITPHISTFAAPNIEHGKTLY
jgi:beta-lactamase class A